MAGTFGGSSQTTRTRVDPVTQNWIDEIKKATEQSASGSAPPGADLSGIGDFLRTLLGPAGQGAAALGGDANALQGLMNPYQSQVIDAANADFDKSGLLANRSVGDAADLAGAFGGSRHGVAEGVATSGIEAARNSTLSGIRSNGFLEAIQRAQGLVGAGMGASQGLQGLDEYQRQAALDAQRYRMDTLRRGIEGLPAGSTTRGSQSGGSLSFKIPFLGGSSKTGQG